MSLLHALLLGLHLQGSAGYEHHMQAVWEMRAVVTVPIGREASTDRDWFKNRTNGS